MLASTVAIKVNAHAGETAPVESGLKSALAVQFQVFQDTCATHGAYIQQAMQSCLEQALNAFPRDVCLKDSMDWFDNQMKQSTAKSNLTAVCTRCGTGTCTSETITALQSPEVATALHRFRHTSRRRCKETRAGVARVTELVL